MRQKLFLSLLILGMLISPNFIFAAKLTVSAGPDQSVYGNQSIILQGSIEGNSSNYYWNCTDGSLSDSDVLQPVFTAPRVNQNTKVTCALDVYSQSSGKVSSSVNILVRKYGLLPTIDLKANGYNGTINLAPNGFVILTWDIVNAISCYASGNWSGDKPLTLGFERKMNLGSGQQYEYTLTCSNSGGSISDSVIVNVRDPNAPEANIYANNSRLSINIYPKTPVTLYWSSTNATACYAAGDWSGQKTISGVEKIRDITSSKTFKITCVGKNNSTASDQVRVNVINP